MKTKFLIFALLISLITCLTFSACTQDSPPPIPSVTTEGNENTQNDVQSYEAQIKELEKKIIELQQNQSVADKETEELLKTLQEKIDELKAQSAQSNAATTTKAQATSIFIYSISDGKAFIDGFTGNDEHIVIPSEIDGFDVYGITDNAFENYSFKSVIISEGVEEIDWFAFYNCKNLVSITIPSSVRKIGHSAFSGSSKNFTIYCPSGSFAQSYAQSYGITYASI